MPTYKVKLPAYTLTTVIGPKKHYLCPVIFTEFYAMSADDAIANIGNPTVHAAGVRLTILRPPPSNVIPEYKDKARVSKRNISYQQFMAMPWQEFDITIPEVENVRSDAT